jgi:hypothetical protein
VRGRWLFPEVMNWPFVEGVALLAINDHWLKHAGLLPAVLTGKLSDFAGLLFFPMLLLALARAATARAGAVPRPCPAALLGAVVATGLGFAAAKATPWGADLYRAIVGHVVGSVHFVADPTDLVALAILPLSYFVGQRSIRNNFNRTMEDASAGSAGGGDDVRPPGQLLSAGQGPGVDDSAARPLTLWAPPVVALGVNRIGML